MAYCTIEDVYAFIGRDGVTAFTDDDLDGIDSTEEQEIQDATIERVAALYIDPYIEDRYGQKPEAKASPLLRYANAVYAAAALITRRGNPLPVAVSEERTMVAQVLQDIRDDNAKLPGVAEEADHLACVTNYTPEPLRGVMPIRVDLQQSTGKHPEHVTRWVAKAVHYYD